MQEAVLGRAWEHIRCLESGNSRTSSQFKKNSLHKNKTSTLTTIKMPSDMGDRIRHNCRIIWGPGEYDIEFEQEDFTDFRALVRVDFGTFFGPPLAMTKFCDSMVHAARDLDCLLKLEARDKSKR